MTVRADDRGAVTVEAAIAVLVLVAVLVVTVAGIAAVTDQLRCTDAAREAARLVARGEPERVDRAVSRIAPSGARWDVDVAAGEVTVTVTAPSVGGLLPGVNVTAEAFAVIEPGAAGDERSR
ncbi:TadE family type IV pilus minor pilin [Haloechinothrix sp. LS1_15]|uniref:TadE family type IV pilus minor pilin n=1 Tax=Haloechinothrix sp. LS1_15 TaxID=2652248 RepID=UPI00294AD765|nr:TadE family type IV pilus minor pilin [Haloechinothrix sp. LS1_15]